MAFLHTSTYTDILASLVGSCVVCLLLLLVIVVVVVVIIEWCYTGKKEKNRLFLVCVQCVVNTMVKEIIYKKVIILG